MKPCPLPRPTPTAPSNATNKRNNNTAAATHAAAITLLRHAESGGNGGDTARQSMYLLLQSHQRLAQLRIGDQHRQPLCQPLSQQRPSTEALYSVAQCQTRLQQRDIARDTWRRLMEIYPDSAAAKRAYRQMNPR